MTRTNDIDRFAKQAGFPARRAFSDLSDLYPRLERFAALVAAAERNKLAQWMIDRSYATGHGDTTEDLLEELDWQITESWSKVVMASVEAEREACAALVEENAMACHSPIYRSLLQSNAQAIRERGNT
jgi:hypothetical protein